MKANKQREWNSESDDNRRAKTDQEEDQNYQHQDHAAEQVIFHGIRGQLHQVAAIVIRVDLDIGRQDSPIQLLGLGFDALEYVLRLLAAQHEDDPLNRVVILLIAEFAEPRSMADHDIANVLDADGNAVVAANDDVADIAGIAYQSDTAHVIKLPTLGVESSARIGVVGAQARSLRPEPSGGSRKSVRDRAAPDIA